MSKFSIDFKNSKTHYQLDEEFENSVLKKIRTRKKSNGIKKYIFIVLFILINIGIIILYQADINERNNKDMIKQIIKEMNLD